MKRLALIALLPFALAMPAAAQTAGHMSMPGMTMPMPMANSPSKANTARAKKPSTAKPRHHRRARATRVQPAMAGMPMGAAASSSAPSAPQTPGQAAHDMSGMPGMSKPAAGSTGGAMASMPGMTAPPSSGASGTTPAMPGMKAMDMSSQGMAAMPAMRDEPAIPKTPPPPPPKDHAAERFFDPAVMAAARTTLQREHGGERLSMVMANIAEHQVRSGGDGYRWDARAWFGGDINRFVLKSEGEGSWRSGVDGAELQGLYSRAISPFFNVQAGVRQDIKPRSRTYVTAGIEGLAPYWYDVEAALFLSNKGELLGRLEGTYDLRLDQRLILQPRVELNLAAQNTPETLTGAGLSNAELGLRLRYEIRREFAPYIGVSYDRKVGKTADYVRAAGENPATTGFVVGLRTWF